MKIMNMFGVFHGVNVCIHGHIKKQCLCDGEKKIQVVECETVQDGSPHIDCEFFEHIDNMLEMPDEATIIMQSGVFHEEYPRYP